MSALDSILLPLDGSVAAARGVGCSVWLADRLGATLHVLSATAEPLPTPEALAALRVPAALGSRVMLHQAKAFPERAVLEAIGEHAVALVVMSARGESAAAEAALAKLVGHVARAVIEESAVPVVLLPAHYREVLPWDSILVPTSGEASADEALAFALRLARPLGLKVSVAHCADGDAGAGEGTPLGRYADAPHHEYPRRLREMVDRAAACCSREECRCLEEVLLCRGDVAAETLKLLERKPRAVLALGWHGDLAAGRARVVKRLLESATCPVVLVKAPQAPPFELKVGAALDRAVDKVAKE